MRGWELNLLFELGGVKASLRGTIRCIQGPPMPGPLKYQLVQEDSGMKVQIYDVTLPTPGAADVVGREFSVKVGEGEAVITPLDGTATLVSGIKAERDAIVTLTLVDIDDAGNRSEARVLTFTSADTIAPPQPGEMSVSLVGEE